VNEAGSAGMLAGTGGASLGGGAGTSPGGAIAGGNGGASGGTSGTPGPVGVHGPLSVSGPRLVDARGQEVQLKGPSSMWLNWESRPFAQDKQGLTWLRDDWKATLVRAAMGVTTTDMRDEDYLSAPENATARVERIVEAAIGVGLYVIIDWHDHEAHLHRDQAISFFTQMAQKWGSYPNVIYEIYNEPLQIEWGSDIKPYHAAVVTAIRAIDPNNVIILGTPNWSQFVDEAAMDPVAGTNLMYTLHFYACTHGAELRERADAARALGLPLFVTEWGATHADGGTRRNPGLCLDEAQRWHDWMNASKISWAAWKFDQCADTTCYFAPNTDVPTTGGWADSMLHGHTPFVRERMRQ
jgi:aryl-phospho-beta-D-glucosidase BglC (GH1 family)